MDIYDFIITLFQKVAEGFATGMLNALTEVMKVKILFNLIGMIVIITFAFHSATSSILTTNSKCCRLPYTKNL